MNITFKLTQTLKFIVQKGYVESKFVLDTNKGWV